MIDVKELMAKVGKIRILTNRLIANQATRRLDDSRYLNGVRISNNEVRSP